jgi:uncharacterized repeat protein (TIGR03803 family)
MKSGNYLYGTTGYGGGGCSVVQAACGTVFRLNLSNNTEIPLHAFSFADGAIPQSAVVKLGNQLWGTTAFGGAHNDGAAFSIPITGGAEIYHYDFAAGADGGNPYGSLINVGGTLYGTALDGGNAGCGYFYPYANGCGTIYKIIPNGIQTLWTFGGGADGGNPVSGLINAGNALYGTTYGDGGSSATGTVFHFVP